MNSTDYQPIDFAGQYKKILAAIVMIPACVMLFSIFVSMFSLNSKDAARIHRGMSQSEVRAILGDPRHIYEDGSWSYHIHDTFDLFHVQFHENGIVKGTSY